ncbi:MAG: His/Gly/Thr/Pro-type tRNA ligase C-terminal domain-containing protein [Clostridia bacterium]|nr:His/Gly/Thr/Pro-type tRNA ligase C-terminal domain-containing protein [Clostridia bacterium]
MKLSNLGLRTKKTIGTEDCYISEFLEQSGQLKKYAAGCFGFGTMLLKIRRNIEDIIRKHFDEIGCAEVQYSILQPKNYWVQSGRWEKYVKSGTMFTTIGRQSEYAISPTAEELSVAMVKDHIKSYRDLGFIHYQIGTKFRDEIRCQGGLVKSKEFNMMDAYSFDENKENMEKNYAKMVDAYHKIFKELGFDNIKNIKSINDMGGKTASEFMFFDEEYGQDTIYCNDELNLYVNEEVFDLQDQTLKEYVLGEYKDTDKSKFEKRKATELGHIFQNDQNYAKMMNGTFTNKEGKQEYYWNGCYGIGITRVVALLAVNQMKKFGKLIWEDSVSAFDVNIICKNDEICLAEGENLYNNLKAKGVKVCFDNRHYSLGEKIKDNELFGIRKIIIIGNEFINNKTYDFEDRKTNNRIKVSYSDLEKELNI